MSKMEQYLNAKNEFERIQVEIIQEIRKEISRIKDLKGVERNGIWMKIPLSSLENSWLPEYYDNLNAANILLKKIQESKNLDNVLKIFQEIIESGKINNHNINKDFTAQIKKIYMKFCM